MRHLPKWLTDSILSDPYSMTPRVEWSIDKSTWRPLRVISGSHTEDSQSQTRWAMSAVVMPDYPVSDLGIHPYGCRVRVFMDIRTIQNTFSLQYGEYVITKVTHVDENITITGNSFEQEVIEAEFAQPRRIPDRRGTSYKDQAETLIREAVPDARFIWSPKLNLTDEKIPRAFYDGNRWQVVDGDDQADSLMNALGAQCYCDYSGAFNFAPIAPVQTPPVWTVASNGVKVGATADLDRTGIHNLLTVAADTYTGDGAGPAFAWDSNPNSVTYAGPDPLHRPGEGAGPYGLKPVKYTNTLINSDAMAQQVATARINNYLGFRRDVAFEAVFHPGLEAEDVVAVETPDGRLATYILDSITYTWGDSTVSCQTRSTKAGDLSDL